jgi:C4-dicarboxylate-specific signal transduction histidine kinase
MKKSAAASSAKQESFAEEMDRRVPQRTAEITAANAKLKKELAEQQGADETAKGRLRRLGQTRRRSVFSSLLD